MKNKLATLLLAIATSLTTFAQSDLPGAPIKRTDFWNDEDFVRGFAESYLPAPVQEPTIDEDEIELFRDLLELIKVQPAAAAARLQKEIKPQSSPALIFVLGSLQLQAGDIDSALRNYQKALAEFPNYRRAHKNLGLIYHQQENFKKATEHFAKAIELGERDASMIGRLAHSYLTMGDPVAAESAYRMAIMFDPETKDWKLGLAQSLLEQEKTGDVIALMNRIIAEKPDDAQFWMFQTNAYLQEERLKDAAVNLEMVKLLGEASVSNLELLGNLYLRMDMPYLALEAFQSILEMDSSAESVDLLIKKADLLVRIQAWNEARKLVNQIHDTYKNSFKDNEEIKVLNMKAKIARATGNDDEAASILTDIIARNPNDGDALLELAQYHEDKGDTERAVMMFDRAAKLDDFRFDALVKHAQMLVGQRKFADAIPLLREALKINDNSRIEDYLARVERAARS